MKPHKTLVFEYNEMPDNIKDLLKKEYEDRSPAVNIYNDSYTRYPYLFDWNWDDDFNILDRWFFLGGASWNMGYVIIHWDW